MPAGSVPKHYSSSVGRVFLRLHQFVKVYVRTLGKMLFQSDY